MSINKDFVAQIAQAANDIDTQINDLYVLIKNVDAKTVFTTKSFDRAFTYNNDIKTEKNEIPIADYNTGTELDAIELSAIQDRKKCMSFNISYFDGKVRPYIRYIYPLINPKTNVVEAIYCYFNAITISSLLSLLLRSHSIYNVTKEDKLDPDIYKLTKREKQVIFLFLSGLNSFEMAHVLTTIEGKSISKNAVDSVFTKQLRIKFDVYSRDGLHTKLLKLGFIRYVPRDLFSGDTKIPLYDLKFY